MTSTAYSTPAPGLPPPPADSSILVTFPDDKLKTMPLAAVLQLVPLGAPGGDGDRWSTGRPTSPEYFDDEKNNFKIKEESVQRSIQVSRVVLWVKKSWDVASIGGLPIAHW